MPRNFPRTMSPMYYRNCWAGCCELKHSKKMPSKMLKRDNSKPKRKNHRRK